MKRRAFSAKFQQVGGRRVREIQDCLVSTAGIPAAVSNVRRFSGALGEAGASAGQFTEVAPYPVGAGCATMSVSSHAARGSNSGTTRMAGVPPDALPTGDPRLDGNPFFHRCFQGALDRQLPSRRLERSAAEGPSCWFTITRTSIRASTSVESTVNTATAVRTTARLNPTPTVKERAEQRECGLLRCVRRRNAVHVPRRPLVLHRPIHEAQGDDHPDNGEKESDADQPDRGVVKRIVWRGTLRTRRRSSSG